MAKGKHSKKGKKDSNPQIRLDNEDFKSHIITVMFPQGMIQTGSEIVLGEKSNLLTSKLFTPEISIIDEPNEEEKSLMKESGSDTLVEFIISTNGIDRDGDTINVEGWSLTNFHKNPVVPWAHNYGLPPVARAINTRVEDGSLKSKAMFTGKELYPFGDMIGKMYKQKFLNAVSVGFNPSKFIFVEDSERKFGIDFIEQELLEYSAVPVPSNPEALIQARSKGIDITPMKEYLEILLDHNAHRKNLDMDVMDELIKILNTSTTTMGKTQDNLEGKANEDGEDEIEIPDTSDTGSDNIDGDTKDLNKDLNKDTDSVDSSENTKDNQKGYIIADDMELILIVDYCKDLLFGGDNNTIDNGIAYKELGRVLKDKFNIEIFDFKYVDSKVLKNFPDRFNFDEETCLLTEKTQKEIDKEIIDRNEEHIKIGLKNIRKINPDYTFKEKKESESLEFSEDFLKEHSSLEDDGDTENVINFEGIDTVDDLKSILKDGIKSSTKTTFNKLTGKLD